MPLDPASRDMMIRTIIGEAGDQSPDGQAAVAHVIMNRTATGQWGNNPSSVVLAPHQFEPWQTRAKELVGISPQSKQYQRVGQIVDSVASGATPDNTAGATHFLDPGIVKARRGGSLPDWAQGPSISIGDHNFYQPGNPNYGDGGLAAINAAIGGKPVAGKALAYTDDSKAAAAPVGGLFTAAGFDVPSKNQSASTATAAPAVAAPAAPAGSLFKDAGFALPGDKPAVSAAPAAPAVPLPPGAANYVTVPGSGPVFVDKAGAVMPQQPGMTEPTAPITAKAAIMAAPTALNSLVDSAVGATGEAFTGALSKMAQGSEEYRSGNPYPSFPSADPKTWGAGGILNYGTGLVGAATSPISGALKAAVADPVTQLTGNPEAGERAAFVAGAGLPIPKAIAATKAALPEGRALSKLVDAIGPENVPAVVSRLSANPRLSIMDVSDPVRTMAQGLIDPAQPQAQNIITKAVKDRMATAPAATNAAYTQAMGPAPNVVQMVEGLKDRARQAGQQAIKPALERAAPVDVSPVISAIDAELKPGIMGLANPGTNLPLSPTQEALARLKMQLTDGQSVVTDPMKLHQIQSATGDMAYQLSKSPDPKDRFVGSALRGANEKLVDQIDAASGEIPLKPGNARFYISQNGSVSTDVTAAKSTPGSRYIDLPTNSRESLATLADPDKVDNLAKPLTGAYRAGRAQFKDAKDISEAFDSGFDTLKNRSGVSGLEDRPESFRQWMNQATPEEVVARRLGTRADIDQKIRGVKNQALAGQSITKVEYNQDKLRMLFGKNEANRLIRHMNDSADEAATNAKILSQSKTAETLAGQRALEVPKVEPFKLGNPVSLAAPALAEGLAYTQGLPPGLVGAAVLAASTGTGIARKVSQKVAQSSALSRNVAIARAASATGSVRQQTMGALLAHPKVVRALQKSGNALTAP